MRCPIIIVALAIMAGAFLLMCGSKKEADTEMEQNAEAPRERMVIYQMMTRLFGNTNTTNKPWGTRDENGVGKFNDISKKALNALKDQGYTHVWFTGVLEHAVLTDYTQFGIPLDDADVVKGRAGSPYAIKDYYDVNPDLAEDVDARKTEFTALMDRTHAAGLKVVIDFVPNHVARAYGSDSKPQDVEDFGTRDDPTMSFKKDNNYYYLPGSSFAVPEGYKALGNNDFPTKDGKFSETPAKVSGNDVFSPQPSVYDWFETVKLNYGVDIQNGRQEYFDPVPDTWLKVRNILRHWADLGVDGFRCDMAEMVPVAFWNWVIKDLKDDYPHLRFIAEIYNPSAYRDYIFEGGFDYLYDKVEMYDTLKNIVTGKASTDGLSPIWQRQEGLSPYMLRFLENHDEQRIASPDFVGDMWKGIPMMAVSAFMHNGPVMMYFGQDVGEPGAGIAGFSGEDGRTTIFDYWGVPEHVKWVNGGAFDGGGLSDDQRSLQEQYRKILIAVNEQPALQNGEFYDLHFYNRNDHYVGYSDQVYAFFRYNKVQVLLVLVNFADQEEQVRLKVPVEAWSSFGLTRDVLSLSSPPVQVNKISTIDYDMQSELELSIPPLSYKLISIE